MSVLLRERDKIRQALNGIIIHILRFYAQNKAVAIKKLIDHHGWLLKSCSVLSNGGLSGERVPGSRTHNQATVAGWYLITGQHYA